MKTMAWAYLLFGLALVVLFATIIVHYYSKTRRRKIEDPKFRMLDDDDQEVP